MSRRDSVQLDPGKGIEQGLPGGGVKMCQRFVLGVNHGQVGRDLLQHRHRRRLVVDENPALAASSDFPPDDERRVLRIQAIRFENLFDTLGGAAFRLEDGRHDRPLGTGSNHVRGGFFAQQQAKGVNEDGLPRPGFARQKAQPGSELDHDVINDGVILESQFLEHGASCDVEIERSIA